MLFASGRASGNLALAFLRPLPASAADWMGKRGDHTSSAYHVQHPPRDKFDPDWKPRRGGKKARKQKGLFERRYREWLERAGVRTVVQEDIEDVQSDDSVQLVIDSQIGLLTRLPKKSKIGLKGQQNTRLESVPILGGVAPNRRNGKRALLLKCSF